MPAFSLVADIAAAPTPGDPADSAGIVPMEFRLSGPDASVASHWWLQSAASGGASVIDAWALADGSGVRIGVVDTGVNPAHQDFIDSPGGGVLGDLPQDDTATHGTRVSGLIVGRIDNSIAGMGVASGAEVVSTRLGFGAATDLSQMALALQAQGALDVSNNSWGFGRAFQDNFLTSTYRPLGLALQEAVETGRDGLGTVFVFAAGNGKLMLNGRNIGDDANFHNLANARQTIAVGSTDATGAAAVFSSPGTNLLLSAPGQGLLTADGVQAGSAGQSFATGTSFSAALVSGTAALMLQVNPGLGYRDVQEILALTARPDPASGGAVVNAAQGVNGGGLLHDREIGFGVLDAEAAVRLARVWTGRHDATNEAALSLDLGGMAAPDPVSQDLVGWLDLPTGEFRLEWVELRLTLTSNSLRDLRIELVSPSGTVSEIAPGLSPVGNGKALHFTFTTAASWGENPGGAWNLRLSHPQTAEGFAVQQATLSFYGNDSGRFDHVFTPAFAELAASDAARRQIVQPEGNDGALILAAIDGTSRIDLHAGEGLIGGHEVTLVGAFDRVIGGDAGNWFRGAAGSEHLAGGAGHDTILGGGGNDLLSGGEGNDRLWGQAGHDTILGGGGHNTLRGGHGHDLITGGTGNDRIHGDHGNDTIIGSLGRDILTGGAGADVFVWTDSGQSPRSGLGRYDRITDFEQGTDRIDLSGLMPGLHFIGTVSYHLWSGTPGELRYSLLPDGTGRILADLDGDRLAEFAIDLLRGPATLTAADFLF